MGQLDRGEIKIFPYAAYMPLFLIVPRYMDVNSGNGEKFDFFSNFLAYPVETPWLILTVLHQNVRRSTLCPIYWITFGNAERNRNDSCPMHEWDHPPFFEFLTPLPPPLGADGPQRGKRHVGRHSPYTNKIWCGTVHALLRYRSKTAKMQKFPIDSYSNEFSPLFPSAGGR